MGRKRTLSVRQRSNKKKRSQPDWSSLPQELLELILSNSTYFNMSNFRKVCSSWRAAAQSYHERFSPFLVIPSSDQEEGDYGERDFNIFRLGNGKFVELNSAKDFDESSFIGSSHGWIMTLDKNSIPQLFNPFCNLQIILPKTMQDMQETANVKGVLSTDPLKDNNFMVVLLYRDLGYSRLELYKHGSGELVALPSTGREEYSDIICKDNLLLALLGDSLWIDIWDLNTSSAPEKMRSIKLIPRNLLEDNKMFPLYLYNHKSYLVSSLDEVFIAVRYIGEYVTPDGSVVFNPDDLPFESNYPTCCPYRTKYFNIYKVDFDHKDLVKVESLGDRALFLGTNHSVALSVKEHPGCERNSIYFTDDYWERMYEDYLYGGHDSGIFKLDSGRIDPISGIDMDCKMAPTPFWAVPSSG